MSGHSAEKDAPWKCPKPDCHEGIDAHNLARFLDHMMYDEPGFTAGDAQEVADRVIGKADEVFDGLASEVFGTSPTSPGRDADE